jgi:transposase
MPAYFFRSEPGAAELRRLARRESGRVCQRVLMIANMLEGMEHEKAARLAGLSRSAAYEWHNRYEEDGIEGLRDRPRPGRQPRVDATTSARFKERIVAGAELQRDGVVAFRAVDKLPINPSVTRQRRARKARSTSAQSLHNVSDKPAGHLRKHTRAPLLWSPCCRAHLWRSHQLSYAFRWFRRPLPLVVRRRRPRWDRHSRRERHQPHIRRRARSE